MRRTYPFLLAMALAATTSCGDDGPGTSTDNSDLPRLPQLLPNPATGFLVFDRLAPPSEQRIGALVVVNGGQEDLVVSDVTLAGADAGVYGLPASADLPITILSRTARDLPVTFLPPARGLYQASMQVTSNAENLPTTTLQLVGAAPADPISIEPDAVLFETSTQAREVLRPVCVPFGGGGGGSGPECGGGMCGSPWPECPYGTLQWLSDVAAFARVFNVGYQTLEISGVSMDGPDTAAFVVPDDTPTPGAACDPMTPSPCGGPACVLDEVTCAGNPICDLYVCAPIRVLSGSFFVFPVLYAPAGSGTHDITVRLQSNDPNAPELAVSIQGETPP